MSFWFNEIFIILIIDEMTRLELKIMIFKYLLKDLRKSINFKLGVFFLFLKKES